MLIYSVLFSEGKLIVIYTITMHNKKIHMYLYAAGEKQFNNESRYKRKAQDRTEKGKYGCRKFFFTHRVRPASIGSPKLSEEIPCKQ